MGHSHYWERPRRLSAKPFGRALVDCRRLLSELNVPLAGSDGTGPPIFRSDAVVFNGVGEHGHETFAVRLEESETDDNGPVFSYCKTAHKPYDLAVQVALIVLQHHLGKDFQVTSDGDDTEWERARRVCQEQLGYGGDFQLGS